MPLDTTTYPYSSLVYIASEIGGRYFQGSGVLISPDEVLTASHVVYGAGVGLATELTVAAGYNAGATPFGVASGAFVHYHYVGNSDGTISGDDSQYDYAVIHLYQSFPGAGTMGLAANFREGGVNVSGYPAAGGGSLVNSTQHAVQDATYSLLDYTSTGQGSSGGPLWIVGSGGAQVVGIVSSEVGGVGSRGYAAQITTAAYNQIMAWVAGDDGATSDAPSIAIHDTTTNSVLPGTSTPYAGPVPGLTDEYINITTDSLNIATGSTNWFVHSGSGNDAISVASGGGNNVLDGGTGSNFLTGGAGSDTFFVDDRGFSGDIWSTVGNFHSGDSATIWGVIPSAFAFDWEDGQGAAGYTGLTLHASAAGLPTASLTLIGFDRADMASGRISVAFGTDAGSGSAYMYVHDNG